MESSQVEWNKKLFVLLFGHIKGKATSAPRLVYPGPLLVYPRRTPSIDCGRILLFMLYIPFRSVETFIIRLSPFAVSIYPHKYSRIYINYILERNRGRIYSLRKVVHKLLRSLIVKIKYKTELQNKFFLKSKTPLNCLN